LCGPFAAIEKSAARKGKLATGMPRGAFNNFSPIAIASQSSFADFEISWVGFDGKDECAREEAQEKRTGKSYVGAEIDNHLG
jgi:hypothetical protein